jgi:hypothetical protein
MTEVFVDTSGWAVCFVSAEPLHSLATDLMRQRQQRGLRAVATNYVLEIHVLIRGLKPTAAR